MDIKLYDADSQGVETPWDHTFSDAIFILLILYTSLNLTPTSVCSIDTMFYVDQDDNKTTHFVHWKFAVKYNLNSHRILKANGNWY